MELHDAIKTIVDQFGKDVIAEKRFVYMLADYYSFRDNPAEKRVLIVLVNDGYTARLLNQSESLDISIISNQIIEDVCKNYGFREELVVDVFFGIMKGLSIKFNYHTKNETQSSEKRIPTITKKPQSQNVHKKEVSLYSGEELLIILGDIFMLPLRTGRNGDVQKAMMKQLLGEDEGQFVLDYFLDKGVIKWSPSLKAYYTTYGNAKEFVRLHDKEQQKANGQI